LKDEAFTNRKIRVVVFFRHFDAAHAEEADR
jgi:hypothetical protein